MFSVPFLEREREKNAECGESVDVKKYVHAKA